MRFFRWSFRKCYPGRVEVFRNCQSYYWHQIQTNGQIACPSETFANFGNANRAAEVQARYLGCKVVVLDDKAT
jgi:hypothetical protein